LDLRNFSRPRDIAAREIGDDFPAIAIALETKVENNIWKIFGDGISAILKYGDSFQITEPAFYQQMLDFKDNRLR